MKKILISICFVVFAQQLVAQSINGKSVSSWNKCIDVSAREFRTGRCLGSNKKEGIKQAYAEITNNCDQKVTVEWRFSGSIAVSGTKQNDRIKPLDLQPEQTQKVEVCDCYVNSGVIEIVRVLSKGNKNTSVSSNSTWNENNSVLSDESKDFVKNGVQLPNESIYQKRQREAQEQRSREQQQQNKQQQEVNSFIQQQNTYNDAVMANYEELRKGLHGLVDQMFNNNWAKESDFERRRSNYTSIYATNPNDIISEYKNNVRKLDVLYQQKSNETAAQTRQRLAKAKQLASNETESAVLSGAAVLGGIIGQSNNAKEEREAKEELAREKERKLNTAAKKAVRKYIPVAKQYLERAKYAVSKENEDYYLQNYNYYNCIIANARSFMDGDDNCSKPEEKTITLRKQLTGQDYFNTYKRKAESNNKDIRKKAEYFLELAINKEPNNINWLMEKVNSDNSTLKEKLAASKKCLIIDSNNRDCKRKYERLERLFIAREKWKKGSISSSREKTLRKIKRKRDSNNLVYFKREKLLSSFKNKYKFLSNEFNGIYKVKLKSKYGYIDKDEKIIIPFDYKELSDVKNGIILGKYKGKYGILNSLGEVLVPFNSKEKPKLFDNGMFLIYNKSKNSTTLFNNKGSKINDLSGYSSLSEYKNGMMRVKKGNKYGFINEKGEEVVPTIYQLADQFDNGLAVVVTDEKLKYIINKKGERLNKKGYEKMTKEEENGLRRVSLGNKWTYIDREGNEKIDLIYDMVNPFMSFYESIATVIKDNKYGFIDSNCRLLIPPKYDDYKNASEYMIIVYKKGKKGLVNAYGLEIAPPIYDDIVAFGRHSVLVKKKNLYGVIGYFGDKLTELEFSIAVPTFSDKGNLYDAYLLNGKKYEFKKL